MSETKIPFYGWININSIPYTLNKDLEYITGEFSVTIIATILVDSVSEKRIENYERLDISFEKAGSQVDIKNITEALLKSDSSDINQKTELILTMFCRREQIKIN